MTDGKATEFSQMDLPAPKPSVGARIKAHFKKWWWVHVIIVVVVVLVVVLPVYVVVDVTQCKTQLSGAGILTVSQDLYRLPKDRTKRCEQINPERHEHGHHRPIPGIVSPAADAGHRVY